MRTRILAIVALAAAVALSLVACGSGSDGAAPSTTEATTVTTATTLPTTQPTTVAPTSAPSTAPATAPTTTVPGTTVPPVIPKDAKAYADAFMKAWAAGNRSLALVYGIPSAVDSLFAYEAGGEEGAPPPDWKFVECEGAAGSSYCTFSAGGDPKIIVRVLNEMASLGQARAVSEVQIEG